MGSTPPIVSPKIQPNINNNSNNFGFGTDLMGFSTTNTQSNPVSYTTNNNNINFLDFGGSTQPTINNSNSNNNNNNLMGGLNFAPQNIPQTPPQNNNFGFNLLSNNQSGTGQQNQNIQQTIPQNSFQPTFQPIVNNNPNKILGYENAHLQIWMDCIKETADTTKIFTTYINKTNNTITELNVQAAVLKHIKLTINPLSSTTLQPFSK
jgi:AP-1 complex subunit gamma-1